MREDGNVVESNKVLEMLKHVCLRVSITSNIEFFALRTEISKL